MSSDWAGNIEQTAGSWRLETYIRSAGVRGDYIARSGDREAWVALVRADAAEGRDMQASWQAARELSHPNLVAVLDLGEAEVNGAPYFYAAFEPPDDDLGEILAGRVLDVEEARSMILAAGQALSYLHQRALRHGDIAPSSLFIVGEGVKLGVDRISPAGADGAAADLRQLGKTLVRAMTGSARGGGESALATPFREVAIGCAGAPGNGWSAETVLQVMEGSPARAGIQEYQRAGVGGPKQRVPVMGVAVVAGVVILAGLWWSRPAAEPVKQEPLAVVVPPQTQPQPTSSTADRMATPGTMKRSGTGAWAVVAATYATHSAAAARAGKIGEQSPQLRARVFPTEGHGNRYYVLLGSGLTQAEADRLKREARELGAPRDTYVTKLDTR